jgi:DNA-binding transcriptional LysR family regulator
MIDQSLLMMDVAMELRHLRYFVAVAECGHFGRAANQLNIVQPALSMQIRALEEEFGGELFTRTSRKVELTEAGRLLLPEAIRTLEQASHGKTIVQRALRGETGSVRIGFAGNAVLSGRLMEHVRTFRARYPDVELQLVELAPKALIAALSQGQIDVAYTPPAGALTDDLAASKVGEWPMMIALAEDHPLAGKPSVTLEMLAKYPLVVYAAGTGDEVLGQIHRQWNAEGAQLRYATSTLGALAIAASGPGVVLLPDSFTRVAIPYLVYQPISDKRFRAELLLLTRRAETQGAVLAFSQLALENNHNGTL